MGEVTSHRALFPLSLHLTMVWKSLTTTPSYYLANGSVKIWRFSNFLLEHSAYHEIDWGLLPPPSTAFHILGISECKCFNAYT